jgi:hypothetical protein
MEASVWDGFLMAALVWDGVFNGGVGLGRVF